MPRPSRSAHGGITVEEWAASKSPATRHRAYGSIQTEAGPKRVYAYGRTPKEARQKWLEKAEQTRLEAIRAA